jgi:aryl-alcohol dehydrogenase-like predicted oxidoreductase
MEYRSLGRTGVQVSPVCLGCMHFGGRTEESVALGIIDRALDAGINFLDTANVYNRGRSETAVGKALARNGRRDRVVLATKVHGRMRDGDPNARGNHRRHIVAQCEASLTRLGTDWIDLYQIHRPESGVPIDEALRALDDLIRAGKVRYAGTSTFAAWQLVESLWAARTLGLNRFVSEQPPYNLLDRRIERELVPMARTYGFAILPWSPLAAGFLTGKYERGATPPEAWRIQPGSERAETHLQDRAFAVADALGRLAEAKGCTPSQSALAWVMHQPGVTAPIIGPRTPEHLEDNLGALEVEVTQADREALDAVSPPGGVVAPYYEADWGPHAHRW